jgi:hypothetical protein
MLYYATYICCLALEPRQILYKLNTLSDIDQVMVYACCVWRHVADILVFLLYLYLIAFLNYTFNYI